MNTRRQFLGAGGMTVLGGALHHALGAQDVPAKPAAATPQTAGAPTVFGTAPAVGPAVTVDDFAHAEKLMQVTLSPAERAEAAGNWQQSMAAVVERRVGPRKVALGADDAPATTWNPRAVLRGMAEQSGEVVGAAPAAVTRPLPVRDEDIAFATVSELSGWIRLRALTSERLTRIYIERLKRFQLKVNCTITLCEAHALAQSRAADAEIAAGRYRGPLHGVPWGAKDLLDTAGIATTWGAEFYRDRVPAVDAHVVQKLNEAGAVLVAKLSLGALALNDIWFGGQTKNPWNLDEGASGSSAGPGAAVAAGLVAFAMGSETQGSIISPSMRCGVTGLRPTFGRVGRTGAMTLSWTCDKLGPMARSVADTALVLSAIAGYDAQDAGSAAHTEFSVAPVAATIVHLRIGVIDAWMKDANDVEKHALATLRANGAEIVPVTLPDWPYDSLNLLLFAEAAAAFEEMTLDHRVDQLRMQVPDAWPNTFRQARFLSAVDYVQADRLRRKVAREVARVFETVDMLFVPSLRDEPLVIFNFTGHPSLTLRAGFVEVSEERSDWAPDPQRPLKKFAPPRRVPHGVTLIGKLFGEADLCAVGASLEQTLGVASERPQGFA